MNGPSILAKDLWASHERRLIDLFALSLAILAKKDLSGTVEEDDISRQLYFCLREANRKMAEEGRGFDHLPALDSKCQPDADDVQRAPRENTRPDFQYEIVDHQAPPRESSRYYHIECKRLGSKLVANADYVHLGIRRFIEEEHGYGKSCRSGAMIGYVQGTDMCNILYAVNKACSARSIAGLSLSAAGWQDNATTFLDQVLHRTYAFSPFDLRHLWVDLRRHYVS